jgi:hypothetical protein
MFEAPVDIIADTEVTNSNSSARNFTFSPVDLLGTGSYDLIGNTNSDDQITFYQNDGSGSFTRIEIPTFTFHQPRFFADFNNDANLDLLAQTRVVYEGDGALGFEFEVNSSQDQQDEVRVEIGDFNDDGNMDYISLHKFQERLVYYENQGDLQFAPTLIDVHPDFDHGYVVAADYDMDGDLDLVENDDDFRLFENDGNGNFTLDEVIAADVFGKRGDFCAVVDLDNDGFPELVGNSDSFGLYYLKNNAGTYDPTFIHLTDFGFSPEVWTAVIEDVNLDGFADVVSTEIASSGTQRIVYYENDGGTDFRDGVVAYEMDPISFVQNLGNNKSYRDLIHVVDFDSNGSMDIIVNDIMAQKIVRVTYVPTLVDNDGDTYFSDVDCDDNNPDINPGASESCNGLDDNCDDNIDEGLTFSDYFMDADNDGFGDINNSVNDCEHPTGFVLDSTDCDDSNDMINPDAEDIVNNGIDEDCDGMDAVSSVEEILATTIKLSPNPASSFLTIETDTDFDTFSINAINGKVLIDGDFTDKIDLVNLRSGIYFLMMDGDSGRAIKKFVKE